MDEKGGFEKGDPEAKMISELDSEMEANISAFEALEREFQQVLAELVGDEGLETFRLEYEKLHRALKKSHEQEKRLVKKCRELNTEILSNQVESSTYSTVFIIQNNLSVCICRRRLKRLFVCPKRTRRL